VSTQTLLVALAHPDDEVGSAGSILAQQARGDRVVVLWLTRGGMTEAFGPIPDDEVIRRRMEQGQHAGEILGVETRFMDFPDTRVHATPEAAAQVARQIADIRPDGVITFGGAWVRGLRHPDHQACGKIVRDAITLARIKRAVEPHEPHRAFVPVFTYRGLHSNLPIVGVDVEPYLDTILELGAFYMREIKFGDPAWMKERLVRGGREFGVRYAEIFDAWESEPGLVSTLLPASPAGQLVHPERVD
jgi:LmbE family N-acetylglucosaminyl deacetylase